MLMVLVAGDLELTPSGRAPKLSWTRSPSSSSVSWAAVKTKLFSVSPLPKVTFCGTPE